MQSVVVPCVFSEVDVEYWADKLRICLYVEYGEDIEAKLRDLAGMSRAANSSVKLAAIDKVRAELEAI